MKFMRIMRTSLVLLLCLSLLPSCAKDETPENIQMPETHAGAINPDRAKKVQVIHYDEAGNEDMNQTLEENNPFIPLVATVYDKAAETDLIGERRKVFDITMTLDDDSVIALDLYSDMTMEEGDVVLTGQEMYDFLCSFLPVPSVEKTGIETVA